MFVLASNHFRKCFSINAGVWLHMENKFSGKYFQLTVCFNGFDSEMVWSENFHFKSFPNSCAKREREREITPRSRHKPRALWLRTLWLHRFLNLIKYNFDFDFESHPSTLPVNPEPRSRLRLRRDRTPRSHQSLSFPI